MANSAAAHPPPEPATTSDHPSLTRRVTHQMHATVQQRTTLQRRQTAGLAVAGKHVSELEYETWDSGTPFWQHCLAGSLAGVVEHLLMYPVDTLKTHLQTSGGSSLRKVWQATASWISLWRGAQAMAVGCIPAHAAQFSTYEIIKTGFVRLEHGDNHNHSATTTLGPVGSTVAGAAAALSHDVIMVSWRHRRSPMWLSCCSLLTQTFSHFLTGPRRYTQAKIAIRVLWRWIFPCCA